MNDVLRQRVDRCMAALLEGLGWVEEIAAWDDGGVLCVVVGHSYPCGVRIHGPVRAILREWIPVVIPIELVVRTVPPQRNTAAIMPYMGGPTQCVYLTRALR